MSTVTAIGKGGRRRVLRVWVTCVVIVGVVAGLGIAFAGGLPKPPPALPTGNVTAVPLYKNVLVDGGFLCREGLAAGWRSEHSTAGAPTYACSADGQQVAYRGEPGDTGDHRKIEIFQATFHQVRGGERWQFTVQVKGVVRKTYVIVGAEWFDHRYLAEADVYPHLTNRPQDIAVITPPLPADVDALAVYVQLPEINPQTNLEVTVSEASLVRVGPSVSGQGER